MAITKIHNIKTTVDKAIDYICNPAKTDEQIYISSFACSPETAALDFKYTLDHTAASFSADEQDRENKAFHLIQAFLPGEVSYEKAHTIGKELADQILQGKYSYVLTTHIDKGHIHNHLIFCAADNIEHKHYHDCKESYWELRKLSDKLCQKHGLSVIKPDGLRGRKYNEWSASQNDTGWKTQIRKDINQVIKSAATYEEFLAFMKAKGYELKGTSLDGTEGKYISFRPLGKERFVRGSTKSLGRNYTREAILERIQSKQQTSTISKHPRPIIDTISDPKFAENNRLKKWATKENLKIASETYNQMLAKNIHNFSELEDRMSVLQAQNKATHESIILLEHQIRELAEIIKYAEQYKENKPFHDRYEKTKDQDRFFRKYESNLILFFGAERMLQNRKINTSHLQLDKLKEQYSDLIFKKKDCSKQFHTRKTELTELELIQQNMLQYLNTNLPPKHFSTISSYEH